MRWLGVAGAVSIWDVSPAEPVETLADLPSPQAFFDRFVRGSDGLGRPVLLKGAARGMPAMANWASDERLIKDYGRLKMDQVERECKEWRNEFPYEDWSLRKFLNKYKDENECLYSTMTMPREMKADLYFLPFFNCGGMLDQVQSNVLWMSWHQTQSVIHNDQLLNQHCLFSGSKRWTLWRPDAPIATKAYGWWREEEDGKHPDLPNAYGSFAANVDVDDVDLERFPGWAKLQRYEMLMEAGDCAFIPGKWYHHVASQENRTVSAHAWFRQPGRFNATSCAHTGFRVDDFAHRFSDCHFLDLGLPKGKKLKSTCKYRGLQEARAEL